MFESWRTIEAVCWLDGYRAYLEEHENGSRRARTFVSDSPGSFNAGWTHARHITQRNVHPDGMPLDIPEPVVCRTGGL